MSRSILALLGFLSTIAVTSPGPLVAAELLAPRAYFRAPAYCGPCGCLTVANVYHRELRSTYGLGFDPRNYDTAEPHFYFGRVRAYPRYFVDGIPVSGPCWGY